MTPRRKIEAPEVHAAFLVAGAETPTGQAARLAAARPAPGPNAVVPEPAERPLEDEDRKTGGSTTFSIDGHTYETAGITKDQLLECFRLEGVLKKKKVPGLDKVILAQEFNLKSRTRLTDEQAGKFLARLREMAGEV